VRDVDALRDEREEALERVDLVAVEAGVEQRREGGVLGVVVEVRVRAHPPHHPRRRRAARLQPEHPHPLLPGGGGGEAGRISTAVATS
jgi:hypothetical protein